MFDLTSFLPQKEDEPLVRYSSWQEFLAAALPPTVLPPMDAPHLPVQTTLPPPPPVAPSPMDNQGQGAVYPGIGPASGSTGLFQGPSAAVQGANTLQGPVAYTNAIHPMFYINHASFGQSVPPPPVFAAPASAEQSVLAANPWPNLALPGGAGGSVQVGPQRLRRTLARAARNEPYANAVPDGASSSAVQLPPPPPHPIAEQENVGERRRTGEKGEEYLCPCGRWVLVHRRTKHKHDTWPCRLCTIIDPKKDMKLSRKDALKRHIRLKHRDYAELLSQELDLLTSSEENVDEEAIRQAMRALSAGREVPA